MRLRKISIPTLIKEIEDFVKIRDEYNKKTNVNENDSISQEYMKAIRKIESKYLQTDDSDSIIDFFRKYKHYYISDFEKYDTPISKNKNKETRKLSFKEDCENANIDLETNTVVDGNNVQSYEVIHNPDNNFNNNTNTNQTNSREENSLYSTHRLRNYSQINNSQVLTLDDDNTENNGETESNYLPNLNQNRSINENRRISENRSINENRSLLRQTGINRSQHINIGQRNPNPSRYRNVPQVAFNSESPRDLNARSRFVPPRPSTPRFVSPAPLSKVSLPPNFN